MKNLLVAVDESEAALSGARQALALAGPLGAKVTLLFVVPPIVPAGEMPIAPLEELNRAELEHGQQVVQRIAAKLGRADVETRVQVGPPAETIAEVAELEQVDLVVVGSTGKGAVKRLLVGSTADRLVHICSRPVLIVR